MKKRHFLAALLLSVCGAMMAQSQLMTYDECDTDQNNSVSVGDVTKVVNRAASNVMGNQIVKAEDLNAVLNEISEAISSLKNDLKDVKHRLNYIMRESNVSYETDDNGIVANGHEYVDMGMKDAKGNTVYWATCNLGSENPKYAGKYYAWGEVAGYGNTAEDGRWFNWTQYGYSIDGSYSSFSKYNPIDQKTRLDNKDDAANYSWKGDWRMPTTAELNWLADNCTWSWDATKKGFNVTGTTGKTIFFPAAGRRTENDFVGIQETLGGICLWSSELVSGESRYARVLQTTDYIIATDVTRVELIYGDRCWGCQIRPVCSFTE